MVVAMDVMKTVGMLKTAVLMTTVDVMMVVIISIVIKILSLSCRAGSSRRGGGCILYEAYDAAHRPQRLGNSRL